MSKEKTIRTHTVIEDKDHPLIKDAYRVVSETNIPPESPLHHALHAWVKNAYVIIEMFERLGRVSITTRSRVRPEPEENNSMMPLRKNVWKAGIEPEE